MHKDFPVDAGMIGIVPMAAVNRDDGGWLEGGTVIRVQGGRFLNLHYDEGRISITADLNGAVPVPADSDFWVGDLCYVLENNIPVEDRDWDKSAAPGPGYWAACVSSFETPRDGRCFARPFRAGDGLAGLVASTRWGDGLYPGMLQVEGGYAVGVVIETGDVDEYEDEEE